MSQRRNHQRMSLQRTDPAREEQISLWYRGVEQFMARRRMIQRPRLNAAIAGQASRDIPGIREYRLRFRYEPAVSVHNRTAHQSAIRVGLHITGCGVIPKVVRLPV